MRMTGPRETVRHYVAGGREHGGGIGRLVCYIVDHPRNRGRHTVVDTRGPRHSAIHSPQVLALALMTMARDRIARPDMVHHLHIAGRGSTARKLILGAFARWTGARHVIHLHDYDYAQDVARRPAWQRRRIADLFRGADHVIVLGERDRATVTDGLGVDPARVSVVRNCVPDPGEAPARPQGREASILFLGQLGPRKGVPELIAALADAPMRPLAWRAVLAGDGPVEEYRADVAANGLSERVVLTGWLGEADTGALRAAADILVLPSRGEGFAMAVLEGLASTLAVVTTRVGAHDEILEDGKTCLFVPVGDARALSCALAYLVSNEAARARIARAGRALYCAELGIEGYVARLGRLHAGLARPVRRPGARRGVSPVG
ncbi:glycosyltransferase family 4 protein [Acuticoccus kandeliae]|uniref:glycosyltransferase family 4 protein n=1 Tax=Acuticoccus kandeliae TaxID=2073160 RepID=UPI000D3E5981|nr:glycosyltransferase family 4 protein [Acuticoccus kandeliae]